MFHVKQLSSCVGRNLIITILFWHYLNLSTSSRQKVRLSLLALFEKLKTDRLILNALISYVISNPKSRCYIAFRFLLSQEFSLQIYTDSTTFGIVPLSSDLPFLSSLLCLYQIYLCNRNSARPHEQVLDLVLSRKKP